MQFKIKHFILFAALVSLSLSSCKKDEDSPGTINLFTVQDDMAFGEQLDQEIKSNPAQYPLLSENNFPEAYQHIRRIRDSILNTGEVGYDDTFLWEVYIIENDTVLNAFAAPGGYMYYYTGLIKFLDNEAQFAGVMAHEMAHASRRHSTNTLTKVYGIQILLGVLLGQNTNVLVDVAADLALGLGSLAFSRDHEYEADEYAVRYLYATSYDARGIAGFFEKLDSSPSIPEFLSTHPSPDNRLDNIYEKWNELGGKEGNLFVASYEDFKTSLP